MYGTMNQMQTGIRQNRKRLFEQEIRSQVVRYAQYIITRQKLLSLSLPLVIYQKADMQTKQTRARQNQKQNQRPSCTISQ